MDVVYEPLSPGVFAAVTKRCRFGVDALLLARFSRPKNGGAAADLCSGCGAVPLLWFAEGAGPAHADAVELLPEAAALIRLGAQKSGLNERLSAVEADLRALGDLLPAGRYDLVSCNPPYQAQGRGRQSPNPARNLARCEVSCTIEDVCAAAARLLRFGGRFCLCHRPDRLPDLFSAMRRHRIEPKRLRFVQHSAGKAPFLLLAEGRLGGKPGLRTEPVLLLEGPGRNAETLLPNP